MLDAKIVTTSETKARPQLVIPAILAACVLFADRPLVMIVIAQDKSSGKSAGEIDASAFDSLDPFETTLLSDSQATIQPPDQTLKANSGIKAQMQKSPAENLSAKDTEHPLSVKPGTDFLLPKDRPAWVGNSPDFTQKHHRFNVCSNPERTSQATEQSLDIALVMAVREYINERVLNQPDAAGALPISAKYIRQNLIDDPAGYLATATGIDGKSYQKWVQVSISPDQREQFHTWHTEAIQRGRVTQLGLAILILVTGSGGAHLLFARRARRTERLASPPPIPPVLTNKIVKKRGFFHKAAVLLCFAGIGSAVSLPLIARARQPRKIQGKHQILVNSYEKTHHDLAVGR